jgi:TonB family protein
MIDSLNALSAEWFETLLAMTIQSSLFLAAILLVLRIWRGKDAVRLRWIALLGLIKLFLPPLNVLPAAALLLPKSVNEIFVWGENISFGSTAASEPTLSFQAILFVLWLCAAVGLFAFSIIQTIALHRRFKGAIAIDASSYGLPKSVRVVQSSERHSPFVFGVLKPTIVLPVGFETWSIRAQQLVLAHETAHLSQFDHIWNVVQSVAKAIHFFNPLVWAFLKKLDEIREMSCDDAAIAATQTAPADYAAELVAIAEMKFADAIDRRAAIAFSEHYHSLKDRLTYQLSNKGDFKMKNVVFISCIALMIALSLNCESQQKSETVAASLSSSTQEPSDFVVVDEEPEFLNRVTATYPQIAKQNKIEARVIAKALIGENGRAEKVLIAKYAASDSAANLAVRQAFEEEVIKATQTSTFKPAMQNGKAVRTWLMVPYRFKLNPNDATK